MGNVLASVAEPRMVLGVGASGSILGMVGSELAFLWSTWERWEPHQRFERARGMLFSLVIVFVVGIAAPINTDNWAHLGGLLSGFSLGLFAHIRNFEGPKVRILAGVLGFLGNGFSKEIYIFSKEPCISSKEPCVSAKEPYVCTKEPYIFS